MQPPSKSPSETSSAGCPLHGDAAGADNTGGGFERSVKRTKSKRRWWWRGLIVVLISAACLYWFRVPVLQSIASYLVVDEPAAAADYVLIQPYGDRRYDRAAELYHAGLARSILLVERYPNRLMRMGFQPSFVTLTRRALAERGVPANSITVIPGTARGDWDRTRLVRAWLEQQPAVRIVVLCDRFGGRKLRYIFDQILGAEYAGRVRLIALPERSYGESDWWKHREAIVDLFDSYVRLAHTRLSGEGNEEWREWDPKAYEKSLR